MAFSAACECGAEQTVDRVVVQSIDLHMDCMAGRCLDDETVEWLFNSCPEI